jgi:L-amino acid N-acyltransferase YncA
MQHVPGSAETGPVRIAPMTVEHAGAVLAIYQAGIDEGDATFETAAPGWAAFSAARLPGHRFVALGAAGAVGSAGPADARVLGWAAVSPTSRRPAYAGVVEHSVYVDPGARGLGIGRSLLGRLIASTEAAGIWTIQAGIFPENTASVALHLAAGFRVVGRRERIARQHGRWRDVLLVERRSPRL